LVPYSDSVYKTPKTHFNLLLLKTATRTEKLLSNGNSKEKREGFMSHLYSTLGCCGREGRGRRHRGKSRGGAGKRRIGKAGSRWQFYRENLNIRWPKINYSDVIHLTSESSM
jgi:hypothetical protein